MSRIVGDETVAKSFIARTLGTPEGQVICDGCNGGVDFAAKHHELREEATSAEQRNQIPTWTETMYAWAALPKGRGLPHIGFDRVYCEECVERHDSLLTIDPGTQGMDEYVLEIQIRWCGVPGVQPNVYRAEMVDRSNETEGEEV